MNPDVKPETDIDKVPLTTLEQWGGQWRTLYEHKRRLHDVSIKQIVLGQVFTLLIVFAVSTFLNTNKEALLAVGTTLVLYPALADMLSSNAAVLSIGVHHDIENLSGSKTWNVFISIVKTLFVTVLASLVLGILGGLAGVVFFETPFLQTLTLAAVGGSLTALIGMPLMLVATFLTRHWLANPNDLVAPLETAIFSTLTLVVIIYVSRNLL